MPDYNRANTVEDLLRRYNLDGVTKKVTQIQGVLTNTNGILEDFVDTTTENLDLINNQLDGNVTSWFYNYAPTLSNVPASSWTTDEIKNEHLEDLFYDANAGKVYKFVKNGDTYQWLEITNVVGAQTFAVANASQDVLDGNRRIFITTPTVPYDAGDIWADNVNHIMYRCSSSKDSTGTFSMDDWVNSISYSTNDGNKLIESINNVNTSKTISASKLFVTGDEINLTSKTLAIKSDNFEVTAEGNMKCKDAEIRGFINLYDQDTPSTVDPTFVINGDHTMLSMSSYKRWFGWKSVYTGALIYEITDQNIAKAMYLDRPNGKETTISTDGLDTTGTITSVNGVCQGSLEELKKDFEEYNDSALDVVNNIDIYKYRYKTEDDTKKHIGFVIGDNYNYSQEVTNKDNDGVDLYSFVSVCCKAIQEQQKEIEELKEKISKLEEGR